MQRSDHENAFERLGESSSAMYSVAYVPVVVNMMECSPHEQMLYYQSVPPYEVPPEQYSVHPAGLSNFYPGSIPGELIPAYASGTPNYTGQAMYTPSPSIIVPPPQQSPPAKREKKTICVRDPNPGSIDFEEEIMTGVDGIQNPTPLVECHYSIPTLPEYHQSVPSYEVPPQQYSVHPTGLNTFYSGHIPGEFTPASASGTPNYTGQAMYTPSPSIIVPPLQQSPPAKREKKKFCVRDPNHASIFIREEIMTGVGRSQNPILPVGRHSCIPSPPNLNQVVEHDQVIYTVDSAQVLPAPVDLQPDDTPKLESFVQKCVALNAAQNRSSPTDPNSAKAITPEPDKPQPEQVPSEVPAFAAQTLKAISGLDESDAVPPHDNSELQPLFQSSTDSSSILGICSVDAKAATSPAWENISSGTMTPTLPTTIIAAAISAVSAPSPSLSHQAQAPVGICPSTKASTGSEFKDAGQEAADGMKEKVEPTFRRNLRQSFSQVVSSLPKTWNKPKEHVLVEHSQGPDRESGLPSVGGLEKEATDEPLQEEDHKNMYIPDTYILQASKANQCKLELSESRESVKLATVSDSTTDKPALSEEEMEKRSKSIINKFVHINDYEEAIQCVEELEQTTMLYVFVRVGVETTLERSQITRDHMGQLFHQLLQAGTLSKSQFFKGFLETFEIVDDITIDIPYTWQYLAELVIPVLGEGGIPIRELFSEFSKSLLPEARAGMLFSEILRLLCKQMSHMKVGALLRDSGLSWTHLLSETEDVHSFITEQNKPRSAVEATVENSSVLSVTVDSTTIRKPWRRRYNRAVLMRLQFMPASLQRPEGLPHISDVVLDKIKYNDMPLQSDPWGLISRVPDFTPAFVVFNRQSPAERGAPLLNASLMRPPPCKIFKNMPMNGEVKLTRAENAWKRSMKKETTTENPEIKKTRELFRVVRSILNKLTPQMFIQLMNQMIELTIDTEERLNGVVDLVFEKAIDEPNFSVLYGNMCCYLAKLKVTIAEKPNSTVTFQRLLLKRCQKKFLKDKTKDEVIEKKQQELEAATSVSECERLQEELEEAKNKARRRSIGNIKLIGELFKWKLLTETTIHDCMKKLLKNHNEASLEWLCILLTTIGKELDFERARPQMNQYFKKMKQITKERKTSSRVHFMLQEVIDLRLNNWVSRRVEVGPKTIEQIHKDAIFEEQEEQRKVHQQLLINDKRRPVIPQEETWNTVPLPNDRRTIDPNKIPKITKITIDDNIYLGPCLGRAQLNWKAACSGGTDPQSSESDFFHPSSLNQYLLLHPSFQVSLSIPSSSPKVDSRESLSSRGSLGLECNDKQLNLGPSQSGLPSVGGLKATVESPQEEDMNIPDSPKLQPIKASKSKLELSKSRESDKPELSEEEMEKRSKSIINKFLHINDYEEAIQCVEELEQTTMLYVFVRVGVETTLERSQITRDHMGQLFHQLLQAGTLSKSQFFKGFSETLAKADDMAIDIPYMWQYLAELVIPVLREEGISIRELFSEFSKTEARAGILFSKILHLLCKEMSHVKVGALWKDSGLSWADLLPETEDVHSFITEQKLDFTLSDCSSPEELNMFYSWEASKNPAEQQGKRGSAQICNSLLQVNLLRI